MEASPDERLVTLLKGIHVKCARPYMDASEWAMARYTRRTLERSLCGIDGILVREWSEESI